MELKADVLVPPSFSYPLGVTGHLKRSLAENRSTEAELFSITFPLDVYICFPETMLQKTEEFSFFLRQL